MRFLRLNEVKERVGLGRTSIYKLMNEGKFPQAVRIVGRNIAWVDSEIDEWMMDRVTKQRGSAIPEKRFLSHF